MCRLTSSGLVAIVVGAMNHYCRLLPQSPCSLFIVLRLRMSSPPIYLFEVIYKPFALSRVFLLSSRGESVILVKKKAPSRSGFSASMHVVLKTRHVNLNIHVRRYQSHVRSPNLSATRPQLLSIRGATTYIGRGATPYWFIYEPLLVDTPNLYWSLC